MSWITTIDSGFIVKPHVQQRYPLNMHRGAHPNIQSIQVHSEQEEQAKLEAGFSLVRPHIPDPVPERPTLTVEERLLDLEDRIVELEARLSGHDQPASERPDYDPDEEEDEPIAAIAGENVPRRRGRPRKVSADV